MVDRRLMPLVPYWRSRTGASEDDKASRSQAYTAAAENVIPTIRCGRLIFVPVEAADRALGLLPPAPEQIAAE